MENMLLVGENGGELAEMERARSALFPRVHSKFKTGNVFWVKVHHLELVHFFSCLVSGENRRHQELVQAPGYWKPCFKLEKMAEK